ncbi:hypothetical protein GPECTOR_24g234 [Gonium pectorale]|uniref:Uncharacterized protein n=1 Tax=Gonium pectorale TaxID=33097 RepID=A0A150GGK6_GONPE|nr:hypothetical protein GPECTOR_24g234 [Gonium pectorale]|eukprot:KXZ48944.1 hypothetical protein GPECTOR_24g234 [Gonium pectorale]
MRGWASFLLAKGRYLRGVLVADASQALTPGAAATARAPAPLTAVSGCLAFLSSNASSTSSSPAVYTLELRFAVGNLSAGLLDVTWAACVPGAAAAAGGRPAALATRGALRCDVWRSAGAADGGRVPSPRDRPPAASLVLPGGVAGSRYQNCSTWTTNPGCGGVVQFTPLEILAGAAARSPGGALAASPPSPPPPPPPGGAAYHVRCWAYWSGSFRRGLLNMRGASNNTASPITAAAYLGAQQIYNSTALGSPAADPSTGRRSFAPLVSSLGPYYPLLAFEYPDVQPSLVLGLLDGTENFEARALMQIGQEMVLPPATAAAA